MITSKDLQRVVDQINGRFDALNKDIAKLQKQVKELTPEPAPKAEKQVKELTPAPKAKK